jgi:hypothetical protein
MTNPKYLIPLLCVLFAGCTNTSNKENLAYQFIKPIPADKSLFNGDLKELNATTQPALFSFTDFNWKDSTLTLTAYSIDTYKASEIDNLQKGDTILFRNDTIIVSKIEKGRYLTINGGIENGGVELAAYEGGTYRVQLMDDHPQYSELGKVQLPLSDTFTIIDCGDNPDDPYDTIRTNHKQRLENMKEYKHDFIELNTRVKIENGKITNITRNWIP